MRKGEMKIFLILDNFRVSTLASDHSLTVLFHAKNIHFKGHNHQKDIFFFYSKVFPKLAH